MTDTSMEGMGAVLMQLGHALGCLSKKFSPRQKLYVYGKELMAMVFSINKWKSYHFGQKFIVKMEHHSLKFFIERRLSTLM